MDDFVPTILSDDEVDIGSGDESDIDIVSSVVSRKAPQKKKAQKKLAGKRKRGGSDSEEESSAEEEEAEDSDGGFGFSGLASGFAQDDDEDAFDERSSVFEHSQHIRDKIARRLAQREVVSESDDSEDEAEEKADEAAEGASQRSEKAKETKPAKKKSNVIVAPKTLTRATRQVDFHDLKLSQPLLRAIAKQGWEAPTPVQMQTVPAALQGKDLLVNAETGSGKTGAFMLPVLQRLLFRNKADLAIRVLVLLPTRELASQCLEVTEMLAQFTDIRACLAVGGLSMQTQAASLRRQPDIVIATPGRIIDHVRNSQSVSLDDVEILILDEADRLLEAGFTDEIREVISLCPRQRQTLLFSATLTEEVQDLVNLSLNQPVRVHIDPYLGVVKSLTSEFIRVRGDPRAGGEGGMPGNLCREATLLALCKRSFKSHVIVFVESKTLAHRIMIIFGLAGLNAAELHGNMTQLQRLEAITTFREQRVDFLICTDLAARGLDIPGVQTVINMSLPRKLRDYVHRVGRTARAGRSGRSVTMVGESERPLLKKIMRSTTGELISRTVPADAVKKYATKIQGFREDIKAIIMEEHQEKLMRIAEMEANKARNLMTHSDEIRSRPAKTWFQSEAEKLEAKERSGRVHKAHDDPKKVNPKDKQQQQQGDKKKDARKKDDLRGLTRQKKRRKLLMQEIEEHRRERAAEREANPEAFKKPQKPAKEEKPDRGERLSLPSRPRELRYADSKAELGLPEGDSRFKVGLTRTQKKREINDTLKEEKMKAKQKRGGKSLNSFKSKKRYQRR